SNSGGSSSGGGSNGGAGSIGGMASGGLIGGLIGGGSSGGGSSSGGSSGGSSSSGGGSSSGGSEDNDNDDDDDEDDDDEEDDTETVCNPVMAPWGITQYCEDVPKPDDPPEDDDKDEDKDDEDKDDEDDDKDEDKDDCPDTTNVAFYGSVTTGTAGSGRYTLASAGAPQQVVVSSTTLAAGSGAPSPMSMMAAVSGSAVAGVDTYQIVEDRLSNALGLTDPPPPPIKDDPDEKPEPKPKPKPPPKPPHLGGCPLKTPMNVLDDIPEYQRGKEASKKWAAEVEEIAKKYELTKDFTAEDALTIADYTGSWADDANSHLRGNTIPGLRGNNMDQFIDRMDRALDHLPPVEGTFYRGTFMPDELIERFASGEVVEMPEYLSTSSDPAKADRAVEASANKNRPGGENVLLEVTTDNGRNIDPLSRYRGRESEVLIPRDGKFEKVGERTKIIGGKEYKVIEVKQVG
ncbi:ADP-ribosyltransferase, partial [Streptomyces sp. NPDC057137]|uniref:ADP-ribosyltransferase n=1 Tax=Streptomyces sp. NPDC057137 TaxID=3346030 RepID=UPI0036352544